MNKKTIMLALFVAIGAAMADKTSAQQVNIPEIFGGNRGYEEGKIYQDERGTYHYETRERRVWVPEQRKRGIFGTRVEPGHYETIREQVKIYDRNNGYDNYDQYGKKGKKGHPHGMPPGQRKKMGNGGYDRDDRRYDDRRDDDRRDDDRNYDDRRYVDRRN